MKHVVYVYVYPYFRKVLCTSSFVCFIYSFHWCVQNAMIPCCSQEPLPFLCVMYFFLSPFSTSYSSILSHLILPSIYWSTSQTCCSQIHIEHRLGNSIFFHSLSCPNQCKLFNLIISIIIGFSTLAYISLLVNILQFSFLLSYTGPKFFYTLSFQKCSVAFCLSLLLSKFLRHILTFCLLFCSLVLILVSSICFYF